MELLESLDELYEILRDFIFFKEKYKNVLDKNPPSGDTEFLNKDILRKLLTELE